MKLYLVVWMTWEYKNIREPMYGVISLHAQKEHAIQMLKRIVKIQGEDGGWWISEDEICYKPSVVYKVLALETDTVYKDFHLFDAD